MECFKGDQKIFLGKLMLRIKNHSQYSKSSGSKFITKLINKKF